jgi:hypothetical protein
VVLLAPESGSGLDRIQAVVGEHVWTFADFTTTSGIHAGL